MRGLRGLVGLGVALVSTGALAGFYVGGSVLSADRDYEDVDRSTGARAFAGFRFDEVPLILEAGYVDTGEATVGRMDGATDEMKLKFSGVQVGLGYFARLSPKGSGVWLKGGYYNGDTEVKVPPGSLPEDPTLSGTAETSASGGSLGIGGVWKLTPWFGLRAEYETLLGVKDFVEDEDVDLISAGVVFEFGSASAAGEPRMPPPAAAAYSPPSVTQPEPPASPPSAAPAPVVPSTPAAARAALQPGEAHAGDPTVLRARPQASAQIAQAIPAGAPLQLQVRRINGDGAWWFAEYQGVSGWVSENGLVQ